jgi:hypothetical protein
MLLVATLAVVAILLLTSSIKVLDVILHKEIRPTLVPIRSWPTSIAASAMLSADCEGPGRCRVLNRTLESSIGGNNQSSLLRTYPYPLTNSPRFAFVGPPTPRACISVTTAQTFAAGVMCDTYRPSCDLTSNGSELRCTPIPHTPSRLARSLIPEVFRYSAAMNLTQPIMHTLNIKNGRVVSSEDPSTNPFAQLTFGYFRDYSGTGHATSTSSLFID